MVLAGVLAQTPAAADPSAAPDPRDAKIQALEEQLADLARQVQDLKSGTASKFSDIQKTQAAAPKPSVDNGRLTITSGDGAFRASVRGVVHFDTAFYDQDPAKGLGVDFRRGSFGDATEAARARDLNSGTNFRRARLGVDGKAGAWDYSLIYEFGGSGQEDGGRVQDLWVQYNLNPTWRFRIGAFAPPTGLEEVTSTNESLFLERASPAEVVRAIAGGDGRSAVGVFGNGERWTVSAALTGATVGVQSFDEQTAFVGRASHLLIKSPNLNLHGGVNLTQVIDAPDAGPDNAIASRYVLRLRDRPELRVDGTRLVDTGNISANGLTSIGAELGVNWKNWYGQAEYFNIDVDRRNIGTSFSDPSFSGWYVQDSYILTGETRRYSTATGGFGGPRPAKPFDPKAGGWGAWEIAARYSVLDLNDNEGAFGAAAPAGGIRGGEQEITTPGLIWTPNQNVRFLGNVYFVDVDRLSAGAGAFGAGTLTPPAGAQIGQDYIAYALRTQVAF